MVVVQESNHSKIAGTRANVGYICAGVHVCPSCCVFDAIFGEGYKCELVGASKLRNISRGRC